MRLFRQCLLILIASFLIGFAFHHSLQLTNNMQDVELGFHGNMALFITVSLGLVSGIGLVWVFFRIAHKQTKDEDS